MIAPVVRVRNRDGDKHSAITFSSAYENAARVAGIAGLNADAAVIAPKQLVMIRESPARTGYGFGRDGQAELCVLQCSLCKMSKIKCGGVIFTAVQSMRVGKMRLCQTKRAGAQIHLPDKRRLASGYRDRQRQSRIISGMEHHAVKQVPACQRLALFQIHTGAFQSDGCVRHGHVFFQFARFADEKASHDLRCAGQSAHADCRSSRKGTLLSFRRAARRFWPTPAEAVRSARRSACTPHRGKRRRRRVPPPLSRLFFERCVSFCITLLKVCAERADIMRLPLPFQPLSQPSFPQNTPHPSPKDQAAAQSVGQPMWRLVRRPGAYAHFRRG